MIILKMKNMVNVWSKIANVELILELRWDVYVITVNH